MGLNVVVGLAGLLDLGYAAFFAIGSYVYAFGASPFTATQIPFWPMLLVGALIAATLGLLLGAPTLRLRGDYLAIVTLGFGEIVPAVFLNASSFTKGTNGIGGIYKPTLFGFNFTLENPVPYYITMIGDPGGHDGPPLPAPGIPPGPGLDGDPRGRAGGREQRDQHDHDQAPRLRPGRLDRRPGGRVRDLEADLRRPGPVRLPGLVHGPGDGRPGRAWATSGAWPPARS